VSLSAVAAVEGPRGTQTVERHDGTTAQVRGVGEVLAGWTRTIPVEAGNRIIADRGGHDSVWREPQAWQIEVMRRRVAATNSKDFAAWETLHAPGACRTTPQGSLCGPAAMRAAHEALSAAFPDYALELVEASGDGDRLAVRMHASGTHTGTLILSDGTAVPPTGRHFQQDWVALVTFDPEGRIEHFDEFYDEFVLLLQLGLAQPL
jgi:ketosteroid isomerase-like protein